MKKFYIILSLAVLSATVGFVFLKPETQAQNTSSPVAGVATIVNTGYSISFSGPNGGTSGNISYGVEYNNGAMDGFAWSPEYGWVQFNGTSAMVLSLQNPNDKETTEWANGLIKLNGDDGGASGNISYGVSFDPATGASDPTNHWAWGGNVIGWVDF
ncbi:hypothetical protein KKA39_00685, partial [Patescibacteria group bacterium]|nr:hypothetical protein [Patescibacteria group bacterium]MBU1727816.1 hypothetical protein [Patescibacteria group bacterium]